MIPLGIYRTEKVSFAALDPSNEEEENNQLENGEVDDEEGGAEGGQDN